MKPQQAARVLGIATFALMASPHTLAKDTEQERDSDWYIGANIGSSRADIDNRRIGNQLLNPGFSITSINEDDRDKGYKVFVGYDLSRYVALEAGYFDLGNFSFSSATFPAGTLNGELDTRGINLDLVATLPIRSRLSAFARVGVNYAETEGAFSGTAFNGALDSNPSEREANPKFGMGLQYAFNHKLAMRVEAERYRVSNALDDKDDVDLLSVGLIYRFGKKRELAAVEPMRQPIVPAPEPRLETYTLSTAELFAFDSAELRMPQAKLVEIADAIKANNEPKEIVIVGYTDRIGTENYNQKLSERRAMAVKDYLVSRGVAADRLLIEGRGEANPVVNCSETNRMALINCLQPNRRAEINDIVITRTATSN